jgi:hypothetical protein
VFLGDDWFVGVVAVVVVWYVTVVIELVCVVVAVAVTVVIEPICVVV